jgi:hypothetical protein
MRLEVLDRMDLFERSIEERQKRALSVADDALNKAFYRMGGAPQWIAIIEVLAGDADRAIIMSRISLKGRSLNLLSHANERIAWVTGKDRLPPPSASTPISVLWAK